MEQYRGNQYDADLTVGLDDIADDSFDTGYVDLFEYAAEEESPISRLKTLMLSIEWEITDEVLTSFHEELLHAQDYWANDRVILVYIQALQKITRYIYQKKADAHHNAMKVMLSFFYDMEKLVLDKNISEQQKKEILRADVHKFERLKRQIGLGPAPTEPMEEKAPDARPRPATLESGETDPDLYNLKAYILGIDWEITDRELTEISREVKRLQVKWADRKAQRMLLQGIDALGGYIKLMKSASHGDAFTLLNSFFLALEAVVQGDLGYQRTKDLLLSETEKFSRFKEAIADTITPEAIALHKRRVERGATGPGAGPEADVVPADTSEFEQASISAEFSEAESFSEEALEKVSSFFGDLEDEEPLAFDALSAEEALRGVAVETEADDDSDEEALPTMADGRLAPALAETGPDREETGPVAGPAAAAGIPGVDVFSEADDDDDEIPLPRADGELAPALFAADEDEVPGRPGGVPADDEIARHVEGFFTESDLDGEEDEGEPWLDQPGRMVTPALSGFDGDDEASIGDGGGGDFEEALETILVEEGAAGASPRAGDERFAALKSRIDSLGQGISQDRLDAIQAELEAVKESLADKPIERTLTYLVGAVVQSIGKKSGRFDEEAVELLHSVYSHLEKMRGDALDQHQSLIVLANETARILQWQQRMVND